MSDSTGTRRRREGRPAEHGRTCPTETVEWLTTHPNRWHEPTGRPYASRDTAKHHATAIRNMDPEAIVRVVRVTGGWTVWVCHGTPAGTGPQPPERQGGGLPHDADSILHRRMEEWGTGWYGTLARIIREHDRLTR